MSEGFSQDEINEFKEIFDSYDKDKKGEIPYSLAESICDFALRGYPIADAIERINAKMASKKITSLDFDCFLEIYKHPEDVIVEGIREKLIEYDKDLTGLVDRNTFIKIIQKVQPDITDEEICIELHLVDDNKPIDYNNILDNLYYYH